MKQLVIRAFVTGVASGATTFALIGAAYLWLGGALF